MIYIFNIPYVVCCQLANFELKSPLVHGEIKKIMLRGKLNQMVWFRGEMNQEIL
jgi:hypothetical protein